MTVILYKSLQKKSTMNGQILKNWEGVQSHRPADPCRSKPHNPVVLNFDRICLQTLVLIDQAVFLSKGRQTVSNTDTHIHKVTHATNHTYPCLGYCRHG